MILNTVEKYIVCVSKSDRITVTKSFLLLILQTFKGRVCPMYIWIHRVFQFLFLNVFNLLDFVDGFVYFDKKLA